MVIIQNEKGNCENEKEPLFERELLKRNFPTEYHIGVAVDAGSTTIEVVAIDFINKRIMGKRKEQNCQCAYGTDVMMRIMHGLRGWKEKLHEMLGRQIEEMTCDIIESYPYNNFCEIENIKGENLLFFVVGNPTMSHYLLNRDIAGLGGYPFRHAYQGNVVCKGSDVAFVKYDRATVKVLSLVKGHVGGDALAVIGRKKLYRKDKIQLAVDFGTNAEIILNKNGRIQVCSAASGPALEGKEISCGMIAQNGAVTNVKLAKNTGNITLQVIGTDAPKGICGSGLIHLTGELLRTNILQGDGYLPSYEEKECYGIAEKMAMRLVERKGQRAFLLCNDSENEKELYLLQDDIRNIQTALSAIKTGIEILIKNAGIENEQMEEIFVAGALGEHIRETSLLGTGLFPKEWEGKITPIGNAAIEGAMLGLTQGTFFETMERVCMGVEHMELANSELFEALYLRNMDFKK